jgi:hypothetical protein
VQFHPERSGRDGLAFLENIVALATAERAAADRSRLAVATGAVSD